MCRLMCIQFIYVGFVKIILNVIPWKENGNVNDGYNFWYLSKNPLLRNRYRYYLQYYVKVFYNINILSDEKDISEDDKDIYSQATLKLKRKTAKQSD